MLSERPYMRIERRQVSLTEILIVACVVVYLLEAIGFKTGLFWYEAFDLDVRAIRQGQIWRFVTYMFLHDVRNIFHLVMNMLMLWFFGRGLERMIGTRHFAGLFFAGGIFGGVVWMVLNLHVPAVLMGASAGVSALVAGFAILFPEHPIALIWPPVVFKAKYLLLGVVAIELFMAIMAGGSNVAYTAHLGGLAAGVLYARYVIPRIGFPSRRIPRPWERIVPPFPRSRPPNLKIVPKPRAKDAETDDLSASDFVREKVDPILDKIAREGIGSLTRRERRILDEARERMRRDR